MQKRNAPATHEDDPTIEANDTIMVSDGQVSNIDSDHLEELHVSAISDDVIRASGIYTAHTRDELPQPLRWIADRVDTLPALVYPMVEAGCGVTWQVKPQPGSLVDEEGRPRKYICPKKEGSNISPSFIERRPITSATRRVLVVEGTKQALAAMTWTDDTTAVYCIPGIQTWMGGEDGPNPAFARLKGQSVYIIPDADAGSNRAVYDGAQGLGEHCKAWGASPVRFVRMPGHGSQGLDESLPLWTMASALRCLSCGFARRRLSLPARCRSVLVRSSAATLARLATTRARSFIPTCRLKRYGIELGRQLRVNMQA